MRKAKKIFWRSFKKNLVRNIVLGIISIGGIISILIDFFKDYMPKELSIIITFLTALISFITVIAPMFDYYTEKVAVKGENAIIKTIFEYFGIKEANDLDRDYLPSPESLPYDLLDMVASCIHKGPTRFIDRSNIISTKYYIYTLSLVHLEDKLAIMANYMCVLLNNIMSEFERNKISSVHEGFFLIVPYGRNVLLGEALANILHIPILISQTSKVELDSGGQHRLTDNPYEFLYQQYIGTDSLEKYIKDQQLLCINNTDISTIRITGIIIDCNTTRGSQLQSVASTFNQTILPNSKAILDKMRIQSDRELELTFNNISECATLFLASAENAKQYCSNLFKTNNLHLRYFFELTENAKEDIYQNRQKIARFLIHELANDNIIERCAKCCGFEYKNKTNIYQCIKKIN